MVEVYFPISEIRQPKLKVRSLWIKVDFNDWCPYKGKVWTDTETCTGRTLCEDRARD